MKKFLLGTVALVALGTAAGAADLSRPVYTKAPVAPVMSWTGFYLGAGGGFGVLRNQTNSVGGTPLAATSIGQWGGGDADFFGTVSGGYDWQLNQSWVVGIFGDAQFGNLKTDIPAPVVAGLVPGVKNDLSYAAGVRVGYLLSPNVLTYVNGGYSHGDFKSGALVFATNGAPVGGVVTNDFSRDGWFVGTGVEHTLNFLGINAPGWFVKSEYRYAEYDRKVIGTNILGVDTTNVIGFNSKLSEHTASTQLIYKFNWGR